MTANVRQQMAEMLDSFFEEDILDSKFTILEEVEGPENPNFVRDLMKSYFDESKRVVRTVERELLRCYPDFFKIEKVLRRLKGKSASVGARRVKNAISEMRYCLAEGDHEICTAAISCVKEEQEYLETKLDKYFELKDQLRNQVEADEIADQQEKDEEESEEEEP